MIFIQFPNKYISIVVDDSLHVHKKLTKIFKYLKMSGILSHHCLSSGCLAVVDTLQKLQEKSLCKTNFRSTFMNKITMEELTLFPIYFSSRNHFYWLLHTWDTLDSSKGENMVLAYLSTAIKAAVYWLHAREWLFDGNRFVMKHMDSLLLGKQYCRSLVRGCNWESDSWDKAFLSIAGSDRLD